MVDQWRTNVTTQKYLILLKHRIDGHQESTRLEISSGKGSYFYRDSSFNIQVLYSKILKELLSFKVLDAFLYIDQVSIVNLALDNFSSVASLSRKYKKINIYLSDIGVEIKKGKIWGSERQILLENL